MTIDGFVTPAQPLTADDFVVGENVTLDAATELATLEGAATAIANFKQINATTATFASISQMHDAGEAGGSVNAVAIAGTMDSPVSGAVDLNATAISNFFSLDGIIDNAGDNVLIADINQSTNADVFASATTVQDLSSFNNLGSFEGIEGAGAGVVAKLNATAIGNYSAVNFGTSVSE